LTSRGLFALAVLLATAIALPAAAPAHTLSRARAKSAAKRFLDGQNHDYPYDVPKQLTTCKRKSAHTVDCGFRAVSDDGTAECGSVRVRLKHRKSRRASVQYRSDPYMCAAG
jgi:hypothetical protein